MVVVGMIVVVFVDGGDLVLEIVLVVVMVLVIGVRIGVDGVGSVVTDGVRVNIVVGGSVVGEE